MIREADDTEHLEAYTDADWSSDPIARKSTSGGILKNRDDIIRERSELRIRTIPEIGISDVLLKGMWKPINLKIDSGNKWLREKDLYKKIASEDFKKLNLWRGIMNFMLMNSSGQNYRRIRTPSTISWTGWENYTVRLMNCMIQRISRTPDPCTVDNSHTFLVNRRYFLSKMSEETCLAAPKLCRPTFGIRSFRRRFYKATCTCTCRWWWRKRRDTKFEISEQFVDWKFSRPVKERDFTNCGVDQQRLQILELHFDKFPTPQTLTCWRIRFKTEVCPCSNFPAEAMLCINGWSNIVFVTRKNITSGERLFQTIQRGTGWWRVSIDYPIPWTQAEAMVPQRFPMGMLYLKDPVP